MKLCQQNLVNPAVKFIRFHMRGDIPPGAVRLDIKLTLLIAEETGKPHGGSYILFDERELVPVLPEGEKNLE